MFFTPSQIAKSISALRSVHPFHGITFLVCKKAGLPIGRSIVFPLDSETDSFLQKHHRLDPGSDWFFQPFKSSKRWVRSDYSGKGLQAINTQTFVTAFLHERNTRIWGWAPNYVSVLQSRLPQKKRMPAFHLAVWLYREKDWAVTDTAQSVVKLFLEEFAITDAEKQSLFDVDLPNELSLNEIFQPTKPSWDDIRSLVPQAPDAKPDQGGTLAYLETRGLGPADILVLEPANRLTLITGDNGLGKSFILECAWWALTGIWADRPAHPVGSTQRDKVEITFSIAGEHSKAVKKTIPFNWKTISWSQPTKRPTIPGLIVYARVDGSFAVWDPAKQSASPQDLPKNNRVFFTGEEVWNGLTGRIEGLVRDWIRWQNNPSKYPFETFTRVLARLSPPDLGSLVPGEPVRIPDDPRDIPTIRYPYGVTPIVYSSAGVRRIITLAYLIVWAWNEHNVAARQIGSSPQRRMVILVDGMEAHLHPRWQRTVLPALMSIGEMLTEELKIQYLVATHSPLVMASAETVFDEAMDSLVHLELEESGEIKLQEIEFVRFGDVSSWLTSPVFELRHARSSEAEKAIDAAKALQTREDATEQEVRDISAKLIRYLPSDDKFWPRWIVFAERHNVQL